MSGAKLRPYLEQMATASPNDMLVATEVMDTKRTYEIVNKGMFITECLMGQRNHCHEPIYPGRPCRVFVDYDEKIPQRGDEPPAKKPTYEHDLPSRIHEKLAEVMLVQGYVLPTPLVLDSSREGKISFHITWPLEVPSPEVVYNAVSQIAPLFAPGELDLGVYARGFCPTWLRMPYMAKLESEHRLTVNGESFDPDIFEAGLIGKPGPVVCVFAGPGTTANMPPELERVMRVYFDDDVIFQRFQLMSDGTWKFYARVWCKRVNRAHLSNSSKIWCGLTGAVFCKCLDPECRGSTYRLSYQYSF